MHRRPSLLFFLAAAAVIGWLAFKVGPDRPASYSGQNDSPAGEARARTDDDGAPADFGTERRERLESALRQKAARF